MSSLEATGGPRNWQVAGLFVDILGCAESFARTPYRVVQAPYGPVQVMTPADLLVERVLMSTYPQANATAHNCARMLAAVALQGEIELDWSELARLANLPEYRNLTECKALVRAVANELELKSPFDPD